MGLIAACFIGGALWVWLGSHAPARIGELRSPSRQIAPDHTSAKRIRDHKARLVAQAPVIADMISAVVSSGATVGEALGATVDVIDEPARSYLQRVRASIELGAPASVAWAELLDEESLAPVAAAVIRSGHTGSPLGFVLDAAAVDMRQAHRAKVTEVARSAGVRSVAPLALCFLPAYLLVGVVPIVAGFATNIFG